MSTKGQTPEAPQEPAPVLEGVKKEHEQVSAFLRHIDTIAANCKEAAKPLYTYDGRPRYKPEVQAQKEAAAWAPMQQREEEAKELARELEAKAAARRVASHADYTATLGREELELANARRQFVEEDLASLDTMGLRRRVEAMKAQGDSVGLLIASRYLRRELSAVADTPAKAAATLNLLRETEEPQRQWREGYLAEADALTVMTREIEDALDKAYGRDKAKAEARLEAVKAKYHI